MTSYIIYYGPFKPSTEYTIINFLLSFLYNAPTVFSLRFANTDEFIFTNPCEVRKCADLHVIDNKHATEKKRHKVVLGTPSEKLGG